VQQHAQPPRSRRARGTPHAAGHEQPVSQSVQCGRTTMVAVAAPFLFVCCASFVAAEETNDGGWLRPGYHFTRERYHMNDPNGLMWRRDQEDELRYHMFFQSTDPDQKGPHSQWGHTVSPDLVHFKRLPRTPIRGSSGGGVALPPGFVPPPQLAGAKAITINSAPDSPSLSPPTGLHLWYSSDEQLLNWTIFRNASRVQSSNNLTCVICPDLVPSSVSIPATSAITTSGSKHRTRRLAQLSQPAAAAPAAVAAAAAAPQQEGNLSTLSMCSLAQPNAHQTIHGAATSASEVTLLRSRSCFDPRICCIGSSSPSSPDRRWSVASHSSTSTLQIPSRSTTRLKRQCPPRPHGQRLLLRRGTDRPLQQERITAMRHRRSSGSAKAAFLQGSPAARYGRSVR
jgi:hypothetical protein